MCVYVFFYFAHYGVFTLQRTFYRVFYWAIEKSIASLIIDLTPQENVSFSYF